MSWLRNPGPERAVAPEPAAAEVRAFHERLPGYRPTPLVAAEATARELGLARVWVKDESSRLDTPSFKILGASWAVYRTLDEHVGGIADWDTMGDLVAALAPHLPLTLVAATDGNHGRAVAHMARLLGLDAHIFVPAGTAVARIAAITGEGAACTVVDGTYDDAVARSAVEAGDRHLVISDTSWPGYDRVPRRVIEGYATIFSEIDEQLRALRAPPPDVVVVQVGVGALAAAAARHFASRSRTARPVMVAVEPLRAACVMASVRAGRPVTIPGPQDSIMAGLNCGTPSEVAWPDVVGGFDAFMAIPDERAREGMRALARDGIEAGETGAAGVGALAEIMAAENADLRHELGVGPAATALVVCTEGATDPASYRLVVSETA